MELAIGFELRQVRGATRHEDIRHFALYCGIQCREHCPVRKKHIGNEQINFHSLKKLSSIRNAPTHANVIPLFLKQVTEHKRDFAVVVEQ